MQDERKWGLGAGIPASNPFMQIKSVKLSLIHI